MIGDLRDDSLNLGHLRPTKTCPIIGSYAKSSWNRNRLAGIQVKCDCFFIAVHSNAFHVAGRRYRGTIESTTVDDTR